MNELLRLDQTERPLRRRLAALAFLDVVGYSRLMAVDEEATLEAWSALRQTIIEPQTITRRGRVVDRAGDGIFAEFGSALEALYWAMNVQDAAKHYPHTGKALHLRIALHLADVIDGPDGEIRGDGVNITARLQTAAEVGGVIASQAIVDAVQGKTNTAFVDLGLLRLKNLAHPVHAFRLESAPGPARPVRLRRRPIGVALGAVALSTLMLVAVSSGRSVPRERAERLLQQGMAIKCPSFPCAPEMLRKRALFEQAIAADPTLARPYAEAALTYADFVAARLSTDPKEDLRIAARLATHAVALAPDQAFSHNARGTVLRQDPDKLEEALTALLRTLSIDPTYAPARANAGWVLLLLGRPEEAEAYFQAALKAAPRSPSAAVWLNRMGLAGLFLDHEDHGADYFRRAIAQQSQIDALSDVGLERSINLASALALSGDVEGGRQIVEQLRHQYPSLSMNNIFACACSHAPRFSVGMEKLRKGAALAGVPQTD